jgi:type IV secretion system protein VirB2
MKLKTMFFRVWMACMLTFGGLSLAALSSSPALANTGTGSASSSDAKDPISSALCNVVKLINGPAGKAIATIALVFLAIGLFVGKITWGVAVSVAIGIAVLFGASSVIDAITAGITTGTIANC